MKKTRRMPRAAQVKFANAWLEAQGIEKQTIDTHALIDGSLSYEENIKNLKKILNLAGRSKKKATRTMSASECDVSIGNYAAGMNGRETKRACACGDPDACDDLERKAAKPKAKPKPKAKAKPKAKPKPKPKVKPKPKARAKPKQQGGHRAVEASPLSEAGKRVAFMPTWFKRQGLDLQTMDRSSQEFKNHVARYKRAYPLPKKVSKVTTKKRSAQKTMSGKTKPQKKPKKAAKKRCTVVKVKGYTRKCPARRR